MQSWGSGQMELKLREIEKLDLSSQLKDSVFNLPDVYEIEIMLFKQ